MCICGRGEAYMAASDQTTQGSVRHSGSCLILDDKGCLCKGLISREVTGMPTGRSLERGPCRLMLDLQQALLALRSTRARLQRGFRGWALSALPLTPCLPHVFFPV